MRQSATDGDAPPRGGKVLRFIGLSFAVTMGFTVLAITSWPLMDGWLLPYCYKRVLSSGTLQRLPPVRLPSVRRHSAAISKLLSSSESNSGQIIVITGQAHCGKSSVPRAVVESDAGSHSSVPILYINCRAFTDPATVLYGTLTPVMVGALGGLGSLIVAYHKLFNATFDFFTMCQQHPHLSHIIFAQCLGHLQVALESLKHSQHEGDRRPMIVIDGFEDMVELAENNPPATDAGVIARQLARLLVRWAKDDNLCDVLLLVNSCALQSADSSARNSAMGRSFGGLLERSLCCHLPLVEPISPSVLQSALEDDGCLAILAHAVLKSNVGSTPSELSHRLNLPKSLVSESLRQLEAASVVFPVLGPQLPLPPRQYVGDLSYVGDFGGLNIDRKISLHVECHGALFERSVNISRGKLERELRWMGFSAWRWKSKLGLIVDESSLFQLRNGDAIFPVRPWWYVLLDTCLAPLFMLL